MEQGLGSLTLAVVAILYLVFLKGGCLGSEVFLCEGLLDVVHTHWEAPEAVGRFFQCEGYNRLRGSGRSIFAFFVNALHNTVCIRDLFRRYEQNQNSEMWVCKKVSTNAKPHLPNCPLVTKVLKNISGDGRYVDFRTSSR